MGFWSWLPWNQEHTDITTEAQMTNLKTLTATPVITAAPTVTPIVTMLTESDYQRAAAELGCNVRAVKAFAAVESSGGGFLPAPDGRPKILFEAHAFHTATGGKFDGRMDRFGVSLSSPIWDRTLYGASGSHQWCRHDDAAKLDSAAADLACSWGTFQVMGSNWHVCGYSSADAFVAGMHSGAYAHLEAFVSFVRNGGLIHALVDHDWDTLAERYNGSGNVAVYSAKLSYAYTRATD
jgi:hypothetical protein